MTENLIKTVKKVNNNKPKIQEEKVLWELFGKKLIAFKTLKYGEVVGTGILNPLLDKLKFFTMIISQADFYSSGEVGYWRGHRVTNTFAPPVGSLPMIRALKDLVKTHLFHIPTPEAMTFAVSYNCQCHCVHCSAGNHARTDVPELSTAEAFKLIDDAQKLGITILAFTGGEPLMRKDIFKLIHHVDTNKTMPIMFTNGQFLTEENVDKLAKAGLYSIFVSLDSPYPEQHNALRGMPNLYESAIKGMIRAKEKGIFVGLSSYASRSGTNQKFYKKLYELASDLELHNFILFDCVPTGKIVKNTDEMLTPEQRQEIYKYSMNLYKKKAIPPLSSQAWQNSIEGNLAGIGCLAGNIQFYVTAYGDVAPCDFTPLKFGNIREEPLKKIWKKMNHHPGYSQLSTSCRMQNPRFRHAYIDLIPDDAILPYDIYKLPYVDYRRVSLKEDLSKKPELLKIDKK